MKAIVLTFDMNHPITDHMIQTYQAIWPSHPFVFRVPYQVFPRPLKHKYQDKVELIETPRDIKRTVLSLIADLVDSDWIYWCIDDKFLLKINEEKANDCYEWITHIDHDRIQGATFCRARRLLREENLDMATWQRTPAGQVYVRRKNYYQFWIHQFMRVGVLRTLFQTFPDHPFHAKAMDAFTGQEPGMRVMEFSVDQEMYVSTENCASFGESMHSGALTKLCRDSMLRHSIEVPEHYPIMDAHTIIGNL